MFPPHLPIEIVRRVFLNRSRKSRRLFDHTLRCDEMPRLDSSATMSSVDQLRSIRRRAAGIEETFSAASPARMEHLARIRAAIAEGRYHVSAADLAEKLIHHMVAKRSSEP
jgi:anti-sigma28 factor (negative regulator of flagellin synthesis)